jgi:hypothetical protein
MAAPTKSPRPKHRNPNEKNMNFQKGYAMQQAAITRDVANLEQGRASYSRGVGVSEAEVVEMMKKMGREMFGPQPNRTPTFNENLNEIAERATRKTRLRGPY